MAKRYGAGSLACPIVAAIWLFCPAIALAAWKIETIRRTDVIPGQNAIFEVICSDPAGKYPKSYVCLSCAKEPDITELAPIMRIDEKYGMARFEVHIPANADGLWEFEFQISSGAQSLGEIKKLLIPVGSFARLATPPPAAPAAPGPSAVDLPPAAPPAPQVAPVAMAVPLAPPAAAAPAAAVPAVVPPAVAAPASAPAAAVPAPALPNAAMADIRVTFVENPNGIAGAPGEKRSVAYLLENIGQSAVSSLAVRHGTNLRANEETMDRHFAPGMRINGRMNFALEEGMQEFWIEAAPRDGADANPANNRASCPIQIGPPSNRDLEIVNLRLASEPVGIAPGQPLDIYIQVANRGPADVEGVFDVAIQGVEEGIARQSVEGPLRPNETRSTVIRAHAPANLANGLSLWAAVDSSNAIWESDETNNYTRLDLSGKILPAAPPPPPAPY